MSVYATDHADALADITAAGTAVTFSTVTPGTHTPASGTFTAATTASIPGAAIKVKPNQREEEQFRAESAVLASAIVLLFAPTTFGQAPSPQATVVWSGQTYRVAFVTTVAPDGSAIVARVGCVR